MKDATRTIQELKAGDHACLAWESEESHQLALTQFLMEGLRRNEKVAYFNDTHSPTILVDYFKKGSDLQILGKSLVSGQLKLMNVGDVYLRNGSFDVDHTIALLQTETDRALKEGYSALRVTGEMTWIFRGARGSERLFEYESKLNEWFPTSRCVGLCQYDCRRFPQAMMRKAVATHPHVAVNGRVYNNADYLNWPRFQQYQSEETGQPSMGTCSEIALFFSAS